MDISAARDTLFMARALVDIINPSDKADLLASWADFESKIPDYQYAETGELKEWATPNLEDNHFHRHVSHAYVAWPGYESQDSDALRIGVIKAMDASLQLTADRRLLSHTDLHIRPLLKQGLRM